jgi:hypothetical protein
VSGPAERLRKLDSPVATAELAARWLRLRLEVCAVVGAAEGKQQEALAICRRHGFVFETPLDKPDEERTGAERWEKLAFTFYTTLCEIDVPVQSLARRMDEEGL